jgi:hypothetical protein
MKIARHEAVRDWADEHRERTTLDYYDYVKLVEAFVREREIAALQNANAFMAAHPQCDGSHTIIDPEAVVDWEPKPPSEREKICEEIERELMKRLCARYNSSGEAMEECVTEGSIRAVLRRARSRE